MNVADRATAPRRWTFGDNPLDYPCEWCSHVLREHGSHGRCHHEDQVPRRHPSWLTRLDRTVAVRCPCGYKAR